MTLLLSLACTSTEGDCAADFERDETGNCVPLATDPQEALGGEEEEEGEVELVLTQILGPEDGLNGPRDLEFDPYDPTTLWIVNRDDAIVVAWEAGTEAQTSQRFSGSEASHWLAAPSALAFGAEGTFTTSHDDLGQPPEEERDPSNAMGPTLWPTDMQLFDGGRPSHLDMVHDSPLSQGVAWEQDNEYWVHDGYNGSLTLFNFNEPHEPGGTDHSDAVIVRYAEGEMGHLDGVPGHLAFDQDLPNLLYAADPANGRIVVLNIEAGEQLEQISAVPPPPHGSDVAGRYRMLDADIGTLLEAEELGLSTVSGLETHDGLLWLTDPDTSTILVTTPEGAVADSEVLDLPEGSLAGTTFDLDGNLWIVDKVGDRVFRLDVVPVE